jgi:hypothetical protein
MFARLQVLQSGGLDPLRRHLNEHAKLSFIRNGTWTLYVAFCCCAGLLSAAIIPTPFLQV